VEVNIHSPGIYFLKSVVEVKIHSTEIYFCRVLWRLIYIPQGSIFPTEIDPQGMYLNLHHTLQKIDSWGMYINLHNSLQK
jgi:hypothetical protein